MTQVGAFAQKVGRFLHLKDAPPTLVTRSLRSAELAVTETRNDHPVPGLSDSMPAEDAYLVSLKLRDFADCECWERGRCVTKSDIRAGATYLYDLKRDPRYVIDKPFHSLFFICPVRPWTTWRGKAARRGSANSPISPVSAMMT